MDRAFVYRADGLGQPLWTANVTDAAQECINDAGEHIATVRCVRAADPSPGRILSCSLAYTLSALSTTRPKVPPVPSFPSVAESTYTAYPPSRAAVS